MIKRYRIYGIVQGVGFRPFIKRLADRHGIKGIVCNYGPFVEVTAKGDADTLAAFGQAVVLEAPERAAIIKIEEFEIEGDIIAPESFERTSSIHSDKYYNRNVNVSINFEDFTIVESGETEGEIFIPPDLAICDECKKELLDPADRRFHHPFINCTQCGPRLTIIENLPYDRERTGMKMFPMCKKCEAEYTDKVSRRMDAQPVCCNECGPEYFVLRKECSADRDTQEDKIQILTESSEKNNVGSASIAAIKEAADILKNGGIIAVKGIGGFHLVCDAKDNDAVKTLRERKHRPVKPFAVMMKDIETVRKYCQISVSQEQIICGSAAPIVLLEKKDISFSETYHEDSISAKSVEMGNNGLSREVAPGNPTLGLMLPYAPIQILMFEFSGLDCLVMTSGNISGSPICSTDGEALDVLSGFADCILSNNRPILTRADDSVMDFLDDRPYMIRRSRGFAPLPVRVELGEYDCINDVTGRDNSMSDISESNNTFASRRTEIEDDKKEKSRKTVLAIGGELKNTFCIGVGNLFYPSSFIGDLSDIRATEVLEETIYRFEDMLQIAERRPDVIVCDMHPDYQSVQLAEKLAAISGAKLVKLQHHYAHVLSCMAENDHMDKVIGISFDGTGFGEDGSIWGGEVMICDAKGYERVSHITPFMHIGGDTASREGWRIAVSMLRDIYCHGNTDECGVSDSQINKSAYMNIGEKIFSDYDKDRESFHDSAKRIFKAYLESGALTQNELLMQAQMVEKGIGAVRSTSAGRLFDAVSALLGICCKSTFEGEAAMALEFAAEIYAGRDKDLGEYLDFVQKYGLISYPLKSEELSTKEPTVQKDKTVSEYLNKSSHGHNNSSSFMAGNINTAGIFKEICSGVNDNQPADMLAYAFHDMLAEETSKVTSAISVERGLSTVALSGGCFQNRLFTKLLKEKVENCGMNVLTHSMIPTNDGGVSLGQAVAGIMTEV